MELEDAVYNAVARAIETVEEESPGEPSSQTDVVYEISELEFRRLVDDEHWQWDEVETLLRREVERQIEDSFGEMKTGRSTDIQFRVRGDGEWVDLYSADGDPLGFGLGYGDVQAMVGEMEKEQ